MSKGKADGMIVKSPSVPLCQRGNNVCDVFENLSPLWKRGGRGDFKMSGVSI